MIDIRETQENEAIILSEMQKRAFQPLYEKYHDDGNPYLRGVEDILCRLNSLYYRCFTIFEGNEIVGCIWYKCKGKEPSGRELTEGEYYLQRVFIEPEHQGRRIAQTAILLCEKEFQDARYFSVDFPEDMQKNRRCYEKAGFHDTGKRVEVMPGLVLAYLEKSC